MIDRFRIALALPWLFLPLVALPATAQICSVTQITSNELDDRFPALSGAGSRIAFASHADLTGGNPDGNRELLLWDEATGFLQITDTTASTLFAPSKEAMNTDGTRIGFLSDQDLTGGNGDGNFELFLWEEGAGISQITDTSGVSQFQGVLSANGQRIAFGSEADFTGGNADGSGELFLWEDGIGFVQLTAAPSGQSGFPSINSDGDRVAFESPLDLTGGNADGNFEIFLWEDGVGVSQITDTSGGDNRFPSISGDAGRIVFLSETDLTGGNPDGNREVVYWDEIGGFVQITDEDAIDAASNRPVINADGTRIAFDSNGSPDGIALWIEGFGSFQAIPIGGAGPTIDASGTRIALGTGNDVLGSNPENDFEIYLATGCGPSILEIPTTDPWGMALLVLLLTAAAIYALRQMA